MVINPRGQFAQLRRLGLSPRNSYMIGSSHQNLLQPKEPHNLHRDWRNCQIHHRRLHRVGSFCGRPFLILIEKTDYKMRDLTVTNFAKEDIIITGIRVSSKHVRVSAA